MAFFANVRSISAAVLLSFSALLMAEDTPKFTLSMQDADIREVIDLVAKVTGRTFVVDPRVRGQVTVISDTQMNESEIYETFLATLEVYGFSAVNAGDLVKIIGQADIKSAGLEVDTEGNRVGEEIITRVFSIKDVSAAELVPILRPLVAKYGHLASVPSANVLIVADRATNLERLSEIIVLLDKPGTEEGIEVIDLQHAWVGTMITLLERVTSSTNGGDSIGVGGGSIQLVGDERSNRIIIKGDAQARAEIASLIRQLDTPGKENTSYKVIFLNNADAVKMADILVGVTINDSEIGDSSKPSIPVTVLADEDQNALIVRAEPAELAEIESIIAQLDIQREQVLIEAAIVEVSGDNDNDLGVQWATNPDLVEDGLPFASSSFGDGTSIGNIASNAATGIAAAGSNLGALQAVPSGSLFAIADPFGDTPNFAAIIQALESQSNTNLLSTPSVMTLDNSEAFITVGNTVSFTTSGDGSTDNPFIYERQDVGTTLSVVPHIQQDGSVRLEVDQVVESLLGNAQELNPTTSKRQVKTEVLVRDGQTIVLGGLISDTVIETEQRVPILGKIPILGFLFKSTSVSTVKTNLMIILRPTIIADNMDEIRQRRLDGIWELRIQTLDGSRELTQPSIDQLFEGRYIDGAPTP